MGTRRIENEINHHGVEGELNVKVEKETTDLVKYNLYPETGAVTTEGANNIAADPLFKGAAVGDYRLTRNSPAVNAGLKEDWMVDALDLAGNARVNGRTVDLGAYELVVKGLSIIVR